jgi:hypothetical protein
MQLGQSIGGVTCSAMGDKSPFASMTLMKSLTMQLPPEHQGFQLKSVRMRKF